MRALVTHARRLRWLGPHSEDPMWTVSYSQGATVQGAPAAFIPRHRLPTHEQCENLFAAFVTNGHPVWALAMRLMSRSGLRWSELTALCPDDIDFAPRRVHVRRAVEVGHGATHQFKSPKNGLTRTSIYPKSLVDPLQDRIDQVRATVGADGLLFPNRHGEIMRRTTFQPYWIQAAHLAGWPMRTPPRRSAGYGQANKGWRWTGAAQWRPHDLRHVAACWMLFDLHLDPAVVADKLGHADPSFTMKRYVAARGDADLAAMEITDSW